MNLTNHLTNNHDNNICNNDNTKHQNSMAMQQDQNNMNLTPILWQALAQKYQFNFPKDWYRIEAHWLDQIESFQEQPVDCPGRDSKMNNSIIRISQCNESYQLCNSLPQSFIVPKDLKDFTLINNMSTVIKDHRVPVISYCCPVEYKRTFIIRCASFDNSSRVIDTLKRVVKPLRVFNLSSIAPNLDKVESAHKKMRNVCRPGNDENVNKFISRSGKWLRIISKTLKLVKETANILSTEASVILIENNDKGWNSLMSSLIQITLEPHRRTIAGLESLISKDWIYLSGGSNNHSKPDILFILFLDCVYQLYLQNQNRFEYTSEYLRYIFEAQYIYMRASADVSISNFKRGANGYLSKLRRSTFYAFGPESNGNENRRKIVDVASYRCSSIDLVEFGNHQSLRIASKNVDISNLSKLSKNNNTSINEEKDGFLDDPISKFEGGYTKQMLNPFYETERNSSPLLQIYDHIINIKLWTSLYLRWQTKIRYNCMEEIIFFQLDGDVAT